MCALELYPHIGRHIINEDIMIIKRYCTSNLGPGPSELSVAALGSFPCCCSFRSCSVVGPSMVVVSAGDEKCAGDFAWLLRSGLRHCLVSKVWAAALLVCQGLVLGFA